MTGIPWTDVVIDDNFWKPRCETNRNVTLLHGLEMMRQRGYEENFMRAGERLTGGFQGLIYQDSDAYKLLQAIAASLATHPDAELRRQLDRWVDMLEKAQLPDGYLNTYFQLKEPEKQWRNLRDGHELYCAGHLIEAGITDYRARGQRKLLEIGIRFADHIVERFAKHEGYPGHPELELALIELFRVTGERKYYDLARRFVMDRGSHYFAEEHGTPEADYDGTYWQDRVPITDVDVIEGHAVRAAYLLCAATDIVAETHDADIENMLHRVWANVTQKRMYVTGGIGNSSANEGFTVDYDLPNESAYQETCASIAMVFWNHRMALLYAESKYMDALEMALYNGVLSGVSLDGKGFFYENPLASSGGHHRQEWYACACCPPNVARLLASLGDYAYAKDEQALWINLYIGGSVKAKIANADIDLMIKTEYPWHGELEITPNGGACRLMLRIPSWCESWTLTVDGKEVRIQPERGYIAVNGTWDGKKRIVLNLEMPVRMLQSHPAIKGNWGRVAIARGPLIYCFEQIDQEAELRTLIVPPSTCFSEAHDFDLNVATLEGFGFAADSEDWSSGLYRTVSPAKVRVKAIPYGSWDNRGAGAMTVWMPTCLQTDP